MPRNTERDFLYSTHRERMIEHLFLSRLLREAWSRRETTIEVLRPEVDASGYDLVLEHNGVVRHLQLKATRRGSRPSYHKINVGLASKPGGCVLWLEFSDEVSEEKMGIRYRFFGRGPGQPLGLSEFRMAKKTTHDRKGIRGLRKNVRDVPSGQFRKLSGISEVYEVLFSDPLSRGS